MSTGEVVVITGASAGVGRALARRFARDGASIALLARGATGLTAVANEVIKLGGQALAIQIDISNADAVEAAATQIEQELGPIDIWINNAAVELFGRAEKLIPEEIRRVSDVTYHGAVWGTKAALKRMRERGRGTIVQVSSGASYRGIPLQSAYSAAKHAVKGFTESLRVELLHDGVNVHLTMVHLAAMNTPLYTWARSLMPRQAKPMPPVYQPEVAAETIYFAARARRRDLYLGWSAIGARVMNQMAPAVLDRMLARFGFEAQQADRPSPGAQPGNLFEPIEGDFGAHGLFGERARSPAMIEQFMARWGGGGIRAALVAGMSLLDDRK